MELTCVSTLASLSPVSLRAILSSRVVSHPVASHVKRSSMAREGLPGGQKSIVLGLGGFDWVYWLFFYFLYFLEGAAAGRVGRASAAVEGCRVSSSGKIRSNLARRWYMVL
jgi:hypothetical protein